MTEAFSFQDNSDFYHEISCSSKRIVVASEITYETSGTYFTLRLSNKKSADFCFNQRITLSAAEFDLLAQKKKGFKIYRLEELQRKVNKGNDLVVKVISRKDRSTQVEEQKNHDKKLQIKQVKVTK